LCGAIDIKLLLLLFVLPLVPTPNHNNNSATKHVFYAMFPTPALPQDICCYRAHLIPQAQSAIALSAATQKMDKAEQGAAAARHQANELTEQLKRMERQLEKAHVGESQECEIALRYKSEARVWQNAADQEPTHTS
jgi:hypothetical protein